MHETDRRTQGGIARARGGRERCVRERATGRHPTRARERERESEHGAFPYNIFRANIHQAYHELRGRRGRRALNGRLFEPLCVGDSPAVSWATCQEKHEGHGQQRGGPGGHIPQAGLWHTYQRPQQNTHAHIGKIGHSAHHRFVHRLLQLHNIAAPHPGRVHRCRQPRLRGQAVPWQSTNPVLGAAQKPAEPLACQDGVLSRG